MKNSSIKVILGLVILLGCLSSCQDKKSKIYLPNGEIIDGESTIQSYSKIKNITYKQYGGFYCDYDDEFFKQGNLVVENDKIRLSELSNLDIQSLQNYKIQKVVFGKYSVNYYKGDSLVSYVKNKFPGSYSKGDFSNPYKDSTVYILTKKGDIFCEVKYIRFGEPGYFVAFF